MSVWVNAYSLGSCALSVFKDGSATAMTAGEMTTAGVTLSADGAGLVTLTAPAIGSGGGSYQVRVTPAYNTAGRAVRLTAVTNNIANYAFNAIWSPNPAPSGAGPITGAVYEYGPAQAWSYAGAFCESAAF